MQTTMALLEKALTVKRAAAWARDLNLTEGTFTHARKRGRLSPTLAAAIAHELREDPLKWTAVAAIEAEPDTPLRQRLIRSLERAWQHSSLVKWLTRQGKSPAQATA